MSENGFAPPPDDGGWLPHPDEPAWEWHPVTREVRPRQVPVYAPPALPPEALTADLATRLLFASGATPVVPESTGPWCGEAEPPYGVDPDHWTRTAPRFHMTFFNEEPGGLGDTTLNVFGTVTTKLTWANIADGFYRKFFNANPNGWTETGKKHRNINLRAEGETGGKYGAPMFSPFEFNRGHRDNSSAGYSTFVVLDIDGKASSGGKVTIADLNALLEGLHGKVPYIFASSFAHKGSYDIRGRLLLPLAEQMLASDVSKIWPLLNKRYAAGRADPKAKAISQPFFVPTRQEGGAYMCRRWDAGEPIDGTLLLAEAGAAITSRGLTPTKTEIRIVGERLVAGNEMPKMRRGDHVPSHVRGLALVALAEGQPFAGPGAAGPLAEEQREPVLFAAIKEIANRWKSLDPEVVTTDIFDEPLRRMSVHEGAPTREQVIDRLKRLVKGFAMDNAVDIARTLGTGRDTPYTPEELESMAESLGVAPDDLEKLWIVQTGEYHVFVAGQYRSFPSDRALTAIRQCLAPAASARVQLEKIDDKTSKRAKKSLQDLMDDYGTAAERVELSFLEQRSRYDVHSGTFIYAPCPRRPYVAEYNQEIAFWLFLFSHGAMNPQQHEHFLEYLAAIPRVDKPVRALVLLGAKLTGKNLLANGAAQIWADRPVDYEEAVATFNWGLRRCPVVFQDEKPPSDTRTFRSFVQRRNHELNRKNHDPMTLHGSPRLILAANNRELFFSFSESFDKSDPGAIADRLLVIDSGDDHDDGSHPVRDYLRSLPAGTTDEWVEGGGIARHILWLSENVHVTEGTRFLGRPFGTKDMELDLVTGSGLSDLICMWLVKHICEGKPNPQIPPGYVQCTDYGELRVHAAVLSNFWTVYVNTDGTKVPSPNALAKALSSISENRRANITIAGALQKARIPKVSILKHWAEQNGMETAQRIDDGLVNLAERTRRYIDGKGGLN